MPHERATRASVSPRRAVVIVDGVRTPFCKSWGVLNRVPADELCRITIAEAMARVELDPRLVDEVIIGNIAQPAESTTIARVAALKAGVPRRVPGFTVNQNCGSGIQAIVSAFHRIESGAADVIIAGGVESMSRIPFQLGQAFTDDLMRFRRARTLPQRLAALWKARLADLGSVPIPMSPADFGEFIADETEKWAKVVKFLGVKAD